MLTIVLVIAILGLIFNVGMVVFWSIMKAYRAMPMPIIAVIFFGITIASCILNLKGN